jgi:putative FmdB family regulatory protein
MPTYEYRCARCGEDLEVYQTFSEEPLKKHAECGGKLTKVMPSVGIVLKGSGFYKTDNRESSKARKARDESSSSGSESSGSEKSSSEKNGSGSNGSEGGTGNKGSSTGDSSSSAAASDKKNGSKSSGDKTGNKKSPVKSA